MVYRSSGAVSRSAFALALVAIAILAASNVYLLYRDAVQQSVSAPKPAQQLQKFRASGALANVELYFLVIDAGKERGIWANNGLDPEFVAIQRAYTAAEIKNDVVSGIKIGFSPTTETLIARSNGVPVKVVAGYLGDIHQKVFVRADGPIKTAKDLDGKKIGVIAIPSPTSRAAGYVSNKLAVKLEPVAVGNLTNQVVALKTGKVDAFVSAEGAPLRLVDSGELTILVRLSDLVSKPYLGIAVWATDDIIEQNPDLVKRFVKATLETAKYLKENPRYASDIYVKRTNAPKDLADKVAGQINWLSRLSGSELVAGVTNSWQFALESGGIPPNVNVRIEDAVNVRFLP